MGSKLTKPAPKADIASRQATCIYEIRVSGHAEREFWTDCFAGMEFSHRSSAGETRVQGPITGQARLYAQLFKLREMNLVLISVKRI